MSSDQPRDGAPEPGQRPGQTDTGGQTPTSEPRGGQTSAEAAGSIRDRLRSPGPQSSGGDTRESALTGADFRQTDSREQLYAEGRDERQLVGDAGTVGVDAQEPRKEDLDPAAARSAERLVAALFLLSVFGTVGFVATYAFGDFVYGVERYDELYTPLLGTFMALALGGIGAGAVVWAKALMVDEEAVQERHPFGSDPADRAATAEALKAGLQQTQLPRRKLLLGTLAVGGGALAVLPVPLLFSLGRFQDKEEVLETTGWGPGVRLLRSNGTPVKLGDLQYGGIESVFPDVPRGTRLPDSAALLIRMRPEEFSARPGREQWAVDGHVVYSAVCTHLGCPVKLYEQQTHHLLCPCHQSTFAADDGARPIFGPAARSLPQLAVSVDEDGYFTAQADFTEPVGPSYWERDARYSEELEADA